MQVCAVSSSKLTGMAQRFLKDPDPNIEMVDLGGDMARVRCVMRILKSVAVGKACAGPSTGNQQNKQQTVSDMPSAMQAELEEQIQTLKMSLQKKEAELNVMFAIVQKTRVQKAKGCGGAPPSP